MKKLKIIIVENDEDEQLFIREGFTQEGLFDLLALVQSGEELFEYLNAPTAVLPDIILSDLNMPGKGGYDIITEVGQSPRLNQIPVIIFSTSSTKMIIDKCLALGAADYLIKPDTFNEYVPFARGLYEKLVKMKQAG